MLGRICSHRVVPYASLLMPSTTRVRFFLRKLQRPPNATKASPIFLSLSYSKTFKASRSGDGSDPPVPDPYEEDRRQAASYLVTSCGISATAAHRATRFVHDRNKEKALDVILMLRRYGFSESQIDKLVSKRPQLLALREKKLAPKLDFLLNEGFSKEEVADIFSVNSTLLAKHLERGVIATYRYLCATLPSRSDVINALKANNYGLTAEHEPAMKMLRDIGVQEAVIMKLVKSYPPILPQKLEHLEEAVKALLEMGFDPQTKKFGEGLRVLGCISKELWLKKLKIFQDFGWSKSEVIGMFKKRPTFLAVKSESLSYRLNFFIKVIGFDKEFISNYPVILQYRLENRILPRVNILKLLMSKGLIQNKWKDWFSRSDREFFEKYVRKYADEVPGIMKLYESTHAIKEI